MFSVFEGLAESYHLYYQYVNTIQRIRCARISLSDKHMVLFLGGFHSLFRSFWQV